MRKDKEFIAESGKASPFLPSPALLWLGHILLLIIVYGSLYRFDFTVRLAHPLHHLVEWPEWNIGDVVENIAAFMPVGALYAARFPPLGLRRDILAATVIAFLLQIAQLWLPDRDPRMSDAVYNCLGLGLGCGLTLALHQLRRLPHAPSPLVMALALTLLGHLALVAASAARLADWWDYWQVRHDWTVNGQTLQLAIFFTNGFALIGMMRWRPAQADTPRGLGKRLMTLSLVLAVALLLADGWQPHHMAALVLFLGAMMGFAVPQRLLPASLVGIITTIIVWDGVAPFRLMQQPMHWIPFHNLITHVTVVLVADMAWKLFNFSLMAWGLMVSGAGRLQVIAIPSLLALSLELLQTRVASGYPDITDPVLALIMAATVWAVEGQLRSYEAVPPTVRPSIRKVG